MNDGTGYPWSTGDELFAADLNAAFENAVAIGGAACFVSDTPPVGVKDSVLWWDSAGTGLYIKYNDGNSTQWVVTENQNTLPDAPNDANTYGRHAGAWTNLASGAGSLPFLPLSGGTATGCVTINMSAVGTALDVHNTGAPASGVQIRPIGQYEAAPATGYFTNLHSQVNSATTGGRVTDSPTYAGLFESVGYGAGNNYQTAIGAVSTFAGTGGLAQYIGVLSYSHRNVAIAQPTTTVTATLGAPSNTISIADVTNFQVPYGGIPIIIHGNPYQQTGVSGTSGAGTVTVVPPVTVADGTSGNIVTGNNNPEMWGANIYHYDHTGLDSRHTNVGIGIELDFACNGADNAGQIVNGQPSGIRSMLTMVPLQYDTGGTPAEIGAGIVITPGPGVISLKRAISVGINYSQSAFDTRLAVQGGSANAIWLADSQTIAFNTAGTGTQRWDGSTFSGSGGLRVNTNLQVDATIYTPTGMTAGSVYVSGSSSLEGGGNFTGTFAGSPVFSGTVSLSGGLGSLQLTNATSNAINFGTAGSGPPTFTTRSAGTRLILYPLVGPSETDHAIGIGSSMMWVGVPDASSRIAFYAGPTNVAVINGNGSLGLASGLGAFGTAAVTTKPIVTGAKGSNAALASLLAALAAYGLVTDSTSA